jgi:nucleotide-binding universal stress UspA family protein
MSDRVPTGENVTAIDTTSTKPGFSRVLIAIEDARQAGQVAEMARRVGASEVRVLHLNLREVMHGRRFPMETDDEAAYVVEAAVFELRMAGIAASGVVGHALLGKGAEAIVGDATAWGADLIVLGAPHRGEFATRLFGSVSLSVLQRARWPVLIAPQAARGYKAPVPEVQYAGVRS